jgi:predicted RNase H-like HicB family nuclease
MSQLVHLKVSGSKHNWRINTMYDYVIEQGETSWGAYVPELPGCVAVAESEDEVRVLILEAIQEHLELLNETVPM